MNNNSKYVINMETFPHRHDTKTFAQRFKEANNVETFPRVRYNNISTFRKKSYQTENIIRYDPNFLNNVGKVASCGFIGLFAFIGYCMISNSKQENSQINTQSNHTTLNTLLQKDIKIDEAQFKTYYITPSLIKYISPDL